MFETVRFEAEERLTSSVVIAFGLGAFAAMVVLIAPGILGEVDMEALLAQMPPALVETMGLAQMGTLEGFLALELYQFVWIIGLGAYVAYAAAGTIAGDIETNRMDMLLAGPISRRRLLLEKFLALLTPIFVVNVVVFWVVYAGSLFIDDPLAVADLVAVHALSIPYLLACGAFGMLVSVVAPRRYVAEGVAAGAIIGTFLLESVVSTTDVSWLGGIAPMRYYDPLSILTTSEYDLAGAGVLLGAAFVLLIAGIRVFEEADVQ